MTEKEMLERGIEEIGIVEESALEYRGIEEKEALKVAKALKYCIKVLQEKLEEVGK